MGHIRKGILGGFSGKVGTVGALPQTPLFYFIFFS